MVLFYHKRYINQDLGDNLLHLYSQFLAEFYQYEDEKIKATEHFETGNNYQRKSLEVLAKLDAHKFQSLRKSEIVKQIADAVVFSERWHGVAAGYKMARNIIAKLAEVLGQDEFF